MSESNNNDNNAARRANEPYQDSQVGADAYSGLTDMSSNFPSSMGDTLAMSNLSDYDENTDPLNPDAPRPRASPNPVMPFGSATRVPLATLFTRPASSPAVAFGSVSFPNPMTFGSTAHPSAYDSRLSQIPEEPLDTGRRFGTEERTNWLDEPIGGDNGEAHSPVVLTPEPVADPRRRLRFVTPDNAPFHPDLESMVDIFQEIRRTKRDNLVRTFTTVARPGLMMSNMKRSQHPENKRMAKLLHRVTKPSESATQRKRNYRQLKAFLQRVDGELSILDPTRTRSIATDAGTNADDDVGDADIVDSDTGSDENVENVQNTENAAIAVDAAVSPIPLNDDRLLQRETEWQIKHDQLEAQERELASFRSMLVNQARDFRNQLDDFIKRHEALSQDEVRITRNRNRTSLSLSPSLLRRYSYAAIPSPQTPQVSHASPAVHPEEQSDNEALETDAAAVH
ncbi:hypothetical protein BC940DRAFT_354264 [Gongronella butleri]|nr:hypothetical protein BC940DRAFT_354264 [Gongronella butleri]